MRPRGLCRRTGRERRDPDAGSTTTEIALRLTHRRDLTILTNALTIALMAGAVPGVAVDKPGSRFKAPDRSLSRDRSGNYVTTIVAGKLFPGTAGVALNAGLTYRSFVDLALSPAAIRAVIRAISHLCPVVHRTGINRSSLTRLGAPDLIDSFISDGAISDHHARA